MSERFVHVIVRLETGVMIAEYDCTEEDIPSVSEIIQVPGQIYTSGFEVLEKTVQPLIEEFEEAILVVRPVKD